jgi:hypothetical protein
VELTGEHYDVAVEVSTVFLKKLHVRARNNEGLKTRGDAIEKCDLNRSKQREQRENSPKRNNRAHYCPVKVFMTTISAL